MGREYVLRSTIRPGRNWLLSRQFAKYDPPLYHQGRYELPRCITRRCRPTQVGVGHLCTQRMWRKPVPAPDGQTRPLFPPPFANYELDNAYDELFTPDGRPRSHYQALYQRLMELPAEELKRREQAAEVSFLQQGITFTVYGRDEGTERIIPHDLLPRIITGAEWAIVEKGLIQRITALNLFLKDIYHDGQILAAGVLPRELIYTCRHFRREMRGLEVLRDIYISVVGTDLIRLPDGRFAVLEDNLRVPSGV